VGTTGNIRVPGNGGLLSLEFEVRTTHFVFFSSRGSGADYVCLQCIDVSDSMPGRKCVVRFGLSTNVLRCLDRCLGSLYRTIPRQWRRLEVIAIGQDMLRVGKLDS
jgi:hypothetical protein